MSEFEAAADLRADVEAIAATAIYFAFVVAMEPMDMRYGNYVSSSLRLQSSLPFDDRIQYDRPVLRRIIAGTALRHALVA